jgi:DNA polymerase III alpha subunit
MAIVTVEDLTGRIECTVFPKPTSVEGGADPRSGGGGLGRVEVRDERHRLLLSEVRGYEEARQAPPLPAHRAQGAGASEEYLAGIDEVLSAFPGEAEVYLHVKPDHSRLAMRSRRFRVAEREELIGRLKEHHPTLRARWGKGAA